MGISVFLADDHAILVQGLKRILDDDRFVVAGEAFEGRSALKKILDLKPQVAVIDLKMPLMNGIEIIRESKKKKSPTKFIILTGIHESEYFEGAMKAGAVGYILKDNMASELIDAIFHVMNGNTYISPLVAGKLLQHRWDPDDNDRRDLLMKLSQTEMLVLRYIARNKTSKDIGELMNISAKTVQHHRVNICEKLKLKGAGALLHFASANLQFITVQKFQ